MLLVWNSANLGGKHVASIECVHITKLRLHALVFGKRLYQNDQMPAHTRTSVSNFIPCLPPLVVITLLPSLGESIV